jgi:imidazoleglycerol-phosphate dehydratase/histidinol-phosphatase
VNSLEEMVFLPWVITSLYFLSKQWYIFIIVTNQDWLWLECNPIEVYEKINKKMLEILAWEWIIFDKIFKCPHFESDNCNCRKPLIWMLWDFLQTNNIDYENSYMIWDRDTDIKFAENIWVKWYKLWNLNWKNVYDKIIQR